MNEQITTEAELDALSLPLGSVFTDVQGDVWMVNHFRASEHRTWLHCPETGSFPAEHVLKRGPLTLRWRPDAGPVRVLPSEEDVAYVLTGRFGFPSKAIIEDGDAAAVLALFAAQPTVAQVKAEAWDEGREALAAEFLQQLPASGMCTATRNPYRESEG